MRIEDIEGDEESIEELKNLAISALDEEEDDVNADDDMDESDEDDDDEGDDEEEVLVTLGFVEKPENRWSILRQLFPSKAGGIPAWLDPENLPSGNSCLCDLCGEPLQFLLQVYAPVSEKDSTFHRTLFVFMCPSMACLRRDQHEQWKHEPEKPSRSVKVFRCQLPRTNAFYSRESPIYDGSDMPLGIGAPLCAWCRTWKGDKLCSSCRKARYCSRKHQVKHWREGHKLECRKLSALHLPDANNIGAGASSSANNIDVGASSSEMLKAASKTIWPEYNIIEDDENAISTSDIDEQYKSLMTTQQLDECPIPNLRGFEANDDRKSWVLFQERLSRAPEQVMRYSRDEKAEPLWPTFSGRLSRADIPVCSYCRGPRTFEFQILPQLLYYFNVKNDINSLDWATIVIYTCAESCEGSVSYKEEFAWVQLNSQTVA